jgi:hypothetical protein
MGDWFVWLVRLMFIAIFPLGVGMLFRVWAIGVRKDLRYVADWRGRALKNGSRWANAVLGINAAGGVSLLAVAALVLLTGLRLAVWSGAVAIILWSYYFALRIIRQRDGQSQAYRNNRNGREL